MTCPAPGAADVGVALVLAAVLGVGAAWSGERGSGAPRVTPCGFAVMLDGELRCDADAPWDVAALCGGGRAGPELRHGDALSRATVCATREPRPGGPGWTRLVGDDLAALAVPVDLNAASLEELESLPGVGPALARAIAEARPYARVDELLRVPGIGPARLAAVRGRARVSGEAGRSGHGGEARGWIGSSS